MNQKNLFAQNAPPNQSKNGDSSRLDGSWPSEFDWHEPLAEHFQSPAWSSLVEFVNEERQKESTAIFPAAENVFRAFRLTPLSEVRFVLLGQDPYHGPGQADGLCFSVTEGNKVPPSLRNMFKEMAVDLGCQAPAEGDLSNWARQGGMLLNTVLTVRNGQANSHRKKGWEAFTDDVIRVISENQTNVAFVLWGKPAQTKRALIDSNKHTIIEAPHPSPLSAHRGFFGSKPFSKINEYLASVGKPTVDWV